MQELSFAAHELYEQERARFLACMTLPAAKRPQAFALLALNLELARIPAIVTEEMIGHIRYAWWQESLEALYSSGQSKGHPLLEEIDRSELPQGVVMRLVESYREAYPDPPAGVEEMLAQLVLELLHNDSLRDRRAWQRTAVTLIRHRQLYGAGRNGLLSFKLLINNIV